MNTKIAFDNRLCYEREILRQQAIHQKKLQMILPTCQSPSKVYMDSNEPTRLTHLTTNRKKLQLEKERQTEIYLQNQRLASKMEHIMHRQENALLASGTPTSPIQKVVSPRAVESEDKSPKKPTVKSVHSPAYVHMPGIRLNASQTPMVDCYLSPEFAMGRGTASKKDSLVNRGIQRRRKQQIEEENRRLKERLKGQKPYYNTKKWDAEWQHASHKFQHLHQNGTVGYLLPKPATLRASESSRGTSRSSMASKRVNPKGDLPAIRASVIHGESRGGRFKKQLEAKKAQKARDDQLTGDDEADQYDEPEVIECEPFVLLEATTRKGVELAIEELQIEMHDPATGVIQPGDRGLIVRGRWDGDVEGECYIGMDTLGRVAQEIDDLEMMIKLETVSTLSGMGNFPRLSVVLTEDELQRLLLKLVQVLNVQLFEDTRVLVISSRLMRSPSPTSRDPHDEKTRACRPAARPRTCPSTMSSELPCTSSFEYEAVDMEQDDGEELCADELRQYQLILRKRLASLLNGPDRRRGCRLPGKTYALLQFWYNIDESVLQAKYRTMESSFVHDYQVDQDQVTAMIEQIQNEDIKPSQVVLQFISSLMDSSLPAAPVPSSSQTCAVQQPTARVL